MSYISAIVLSGRKGRFFGHGNEQINTYPKHALVREWPKKNLHQKFNIEAFCISKVLWGHRGGIPYSVDTTGVKDTKEYFKKTVS